MERFSIDSCVRGHHVYQAVWYPDFGETLSCQPEFGNVMDPYAAVSIVKEERIVGHVPRKISAICHLFLRRGGLMVCQIKGHRRFSTDLPQGGLEVPCSFTFIGDSKEIHKVKRLTEHEDIVNSKSIEPSKLIEPPSKKKKTSDSDCEVTRPSKQQSVWVKVNGMILTISDREDILDTSSKKLNDRHINLAQLLLSRQFPNIDGLGCTLFQHKPPVKSISNGLQIIFDRECHWIVANCIGCDSDTIEVYDSMYSDVSKGTKTVILNLFSNNRQRIVQVDVQRQQGVKDCGLFAIAFSTAVLNGDNVRTVSFSQQAMRHHLCDCIDAGLLLPFPSLHDQ